MNTYTQGMLERPIRARWGLVESVDEQYMDLSPDFTRELSRYMAIYMARWIQRGRIKGEWFVGIAALVFFPVVGALCWWAA